jgi:AcrR family transcriptional regulator
MIDRGSRFGELNMRKLARTVGCAHTNIYNYFRSWEELQWAALANALDELVEQLPESSADDVARPEASESPVAIYINYGLSYPHRYRFTWLDPITGSPPPDVEAVLAKPGRAFLRWLEASLNRDAPELLPHAQSVGGYLHGYMHGELAFRAAGRVRGVQPGPDELIGRTARLYYATIDQLRNSQTPPKADH